MNCCPPPTAAAVQEMLHLSARLELLWLVLALQLSTVLLVLAGPVPAPLTATPGGFTPAVFASPHDAPVPSPSQP